MMSMSAELGRYEEIRTLSVAMVDAARANDWERLIALERGVGVLRDALIACTDSTPDTATSAPESGRKRELIQQILADDAEIRRHVEPWMGHVRDFLDSQNHRRQVQKAYAATDSGPGPEAQGGLHA